MTPEKVISETVNSKQSRADALLAALRQGPRLSEEWNADDVSAFLKLARELEATADWHDARNEKPDTDTTVILGFADGETAHGYWCSETEFWRTTDALTAAGVRYWMHCPEVPKD